MLVSHKYKFIFIANGRTGSNSIESALQPFASKFDLTKIEQDVYHRHMPAAILREKFYKNNMASIWEDYYKFSFVRNPWDWTVSQLAFNKFIAPDQNKIEVRNLYKLHRFLSSGAARRNIQWQPYRDQQSMICDMTGQIIVNFVGRFESLERDFSLVCKHLQLPPLKLNVLANSEHNSYLNMYDEMTAIYVQNLFFRDANLFNYSF